MQINPYELNILTREKRGLITRSITGKFRTKDAARYDKILNEITLNRDKKKIAIKNVICILESSIEKLNQSIYLLSHNQKITDIEQHIKTVSTKASNTLSNSDINFSPFPKQGILYNYLLFYSYTIVGSDVKKIYSTPFTK